MSELQVHTTVFFKEGEKWRQGNVAQVYSNFPCVKVRVGKQIICADSRTTLTVQDFEKQCLPKLKEMKAKSLVKGGPRFNSAAIALEFKISPEAAGQMMRNAETLGQL